MLYGDGAPVSAMTNADGTPKDPDKVWIFGGWHKRNNKGENITFTFHPLFRAYLKWSGESPKRVDYALSFGHVRRSLDMLQGMMTAVALEIIVVFLEECVEDFVVGGEEGDEDEKKGLSMWENISAQVKGAFPAAEKAEAPEPPAEAEPIHAKTEV